MHCTEPAARPLLQPRAVVAGWQAVCMLAQLRRSRDGTGDGTEERHRGLVACSLIAPSRGGAAHSRDGTGLCSRGRARGRSALPSSTSAPASHPHASNKRCVQPAARRSALLERSLGLCARHHGLAAAGPGPRGAAARPAARSTQRRGAAGEHLHLFGCAAPHHHATHPAGEEPRPRRKGAALPPAAAALEDYRRLSPRALHPTSWPLGCTPLPDRCFSIS